VARFADFWLINVFNNVVCVVVVVTLADCYVSGDTSI